MWVKVTWFVVYFNNDKWTSNYGNSERSDYKIIVWPSLLYCTGVIGYYVSAKKWEV